jgi:aryl-alcohol dehydrogenase-like predicted oxidoreductase
MPLALAGRLDEADAVRVIHAALDAGMTWIDTADVYCLDDGDIGYGERLVARALRERKGARDDVMVATKGGLRRPGGRWESDARPERLRAACEASLKALGTDSIFLYQLHAPDAKVPWAESVGALANLQKEGKIRHVGLSNVCVGEIEQARRIVPIASVQNRCSAIDRRSFVNGVVDLCQKEKIAFIAHSPVGGHRQQRRVGDHPTLRAVASRNGASPYEVALAWLLASSPVMFVIPGASRAESAQSSARAADLVLGDRDWVDLNKAFPDASPFLKQVAGARRKLRQILRF